MSLNYLELQLRKNSRRLTGLVYSAALDLYFSHVLFCQQNIDRVALVALHHFSFHFILIL